MSKLLSLKTNDRHESEHALGEIEEGRKSPLLRRYSVEPGGFLQVCNCNFFEYRIKQGGYSWFLRIVIVERQSLIMNSRIPQDFLITFPGYENSKG